MRNPWPLVALSVPAAALVAHASRYLPFVADDALISLRYSARLLAGDGLTWTDGERVEGYTHLLWVLRWWPFTLRPVRDAERRTEVRRSDDA